MATFCSQSAMVVPGEPTLENAVLAFEKGQLTAAPKNIIKWLIENGVPPEFWPVAYAKYKGVIYGIVIDPVTSVIYGVVAFRSNGNFVDFLPIDPI